MYLAQSSGIGAPLTSVASPLHFQLWCGEWEQGIIESSAI